MELRLVFFYGVRCGSIVWFSSCVGFGLGFLVSLGLRYRLLCFGGLGLKSWIGFFDEVGVLG